MACVDVMRVKLEGRSLWRSTHFGGPVAESVLLGALPVQRRARLDALCSVCRVWGQLDASAGVHDGIDAKNSPNTQERGTLSRGALSLS